VTGTPTPKLIAYVSLSAGAMFAGLLFGRTELVVLAVPMVATAAFGLAMTNAPNVDLEFVCATRRCLEDEHVDAALALQSDRRAEVDVLVAPSPGLAAEARHFAAIALDHDEPRRVETPLRAVRWGAQAVGEVAVRVHGPGGLVTFRRDFATHTSVRVYPAFEPMRRDIQPPWTQVFTGNYVARASGDGIEFSGVRPFVAGDSRRRVNWKVTSRRRQLHVNQFHPERNADVVLFLDTFADIGAPGRSSLDLTVRGAATMARHYLLRKDRVGLIAFGGLMGWMTARSGQTHLHRVVDYLIGVEATLSYARKEITYLPRRSLPQLALVIAFSPLVDERAIRAFVDLHARGFPLVVIDTLVADSVEPGSSPEDAVAFRAWKLSRAAQRYDLGDLGVPVVPWSGELGLDVIAAQLPALRRLPRKSRA
jgi:uncharacterized protein (DUF58 family)